MRLVHLVMELTPYGVAGAEGRTDRGINPLALCGSQRWAIVAMRSAGVAGVGAARVVLPALDADEHGELMPAGACRRLRSFD